MHENAVVVVKMEVVVG